MVEQGKTSQESTGAAIGKTLRRVPYIARSLQLVWTAAPRATVAWITLLFLQGLLPALTVYLTRALVNSLVSAIDSGGEPTAVRAAVINAVLMGLVLAGIELLRGLSNWIRTALSERVRDVITDRIHERSLAVDLAFYDLPEYYDHLHRAGREASYRPVALLESVGALLQNGLTLGAMMLVLFPYGVWLPIVLLAGTLPALWIVLRNNRRRHAWQRCVTADERRAWYYNWLLTSREPAAELRLFGLGRRFREGYLALRRKLRVEQLLLVRNESLSELAAGLIALLTVGGAMLVVIRQVLRGLLKLGDLALVYQAFSQGQSLMRTLLQSVGQIYGNSLFLSDLFDFLELEPSVRDPDDPLPPPAPEGEAIRFSNVAFRYPNADTTALHGFNLTIPAGKTVAIVGTNGAGKSTFIKLLCRFYDVTEGKIELFGRDVRDMRREDVYRQLSVLFQTPQQFNMTLAENIGLSDPDADEAAIAQAAFDAGADEVVDRLPRGYETVLGIWFVDGTDLSVGEWRRIALARTLLRQSPIVVLDEPTSAMDPWAEAEWVHRFRAYAADKTAVLITHRFTTAMHADTIFVMESGAIVESGSHQELVALGGRYAHSWAEQMAPRPAGHSL